MVLISARNSLDGTSGNITDAPSCDERLIAARDEFTDVNDEEVSDEDGCLSRSVTVKAHRRIMRERIMISRVASEVSFQPLCSDTGAPLREERVVTVRKKPNLHLEFYQRGVTDGVRTHIHFVCFDAKDPTNEEVLVRMQKCESLSGWQM